MGKMGKIRLGTEEIKYITLFETITGAIVKDCFNFDNNLVFVVKEGDMGLAIGKNGSNIEKVRKAFGKGVWVFEFSKDENTFIRNLFHPVPVKQVRISNLENGKVATIEINKKDRRRVIGPKGMRIKIAKELVKRHFDIDNINIKTTSL